MILTNYRDFRRFFAASSTLAADGLPEWPGVAALEDPVLPTFSWSIGLILTFAMPGSLNEWHWYLSQPTEGTGNERLEITYSSAVPSANVRVERTAVGTTESAALIAAGWHPRDVFDLFLRGCHVYAYSPTDSTRYVSDLHRSVFAPESL